MNNNQTLIKQILYYLSDENLQRDEFFYDKVSSNEKHYVDIESFLKCNKIKKLNIAKPQQIIQAVTESENLELSDDKLMIRRKDMSDLPEFKAKKKVKKIESQQQQQVNPFENIETIIFCVSLQKQKTVPFRYIQEALLKTHNIYAPYVRFNKNEGHFAVGKKNMNKNLQQKLQSQGLTVGQTTLTIKEAEGNSLNEFWEKHGHHYNGIIDNLRKNHAKKVKEDKKAQQRAKKVVEFTFAGDKYDDINKLKSLFKNILCRNPNNTPLKEKETEAIKELLSFHERRDQKLKDFKHFVVDVNPSYVDTRCLFVVRNDGTRQDFSVVKCIQKIEEKYAA